MDYFHRYDFGEGWDRGYLEGTLTYDAIKANENSSFQLALAYSKGRRPPAFDKVDEIVFGIGLLQK